MVAFTRKHLFGALESEHKYCHYFRTETLALYNLYPTDPVIVYDSKELISDNDAGSGTIEIVLSAGYTQKKSGRNSLLQNVHMQKKGTHLLMDTFSSDSWLDRE